LVGNYIIQAHEAGFKTLDDSVSSLGSYQGSSFGVSKAWAEANRQTLLAFMRAYMRAMKVVSDESRRDDVVASLAKHTSMDPAIARKTIDKLTSGTHGLTPKAALDMEGVATVLSLRNEYGKPPADLSNLDDFVDLSYYEEALRTIEAE
jgi:ABC-type nitrate/sulfonate/bicarbonate transport system substrate-binding protein